MRVGGYKRDRYLGWDWGHRETEIGGNRQCIGHSPYAFHGLPPNPTRLACHRHFQIPTQTPPPF